MNKNARVINIIILIVLILIAGFGYWWYTQPTQTEKNENEKTPATNETEKSLLEENQISQEKIQTVTCNYDGIHDSGEPCDDGNLNNQDDCLYHCILPSCGDRFLWNQQNGTEECDDGSRNSDTVPNACRTSCSKPFCGDKVADKNEQCDLADFKNYSDGIEKCTEYDSKFISGNLSCRNCAIYTDLCTEAFTALKLNNSGSVAIESITLDEDTSHTFSIWTKIDDPQNTASLIECDEDAIISLRAIGKNYRFKIINDRNNGVERQVNAAFNQGQWTHIAAVHHPSFLKIYINGELKQHEENGKKAEKETKCRIGASYNAELRKFNGAIDDIRIYEEALNHAEIKEIYALGRNNDQRTNTLLAWWKLNEGAGTTLEDSSGNTHTGVIQGGFDWTIEKINSFDQRSG